MESSRDGAVMVEIDSDGLVQRVQIEPEVNAEWTAEVLAERLFPPVHVGWVMGPAVTICAG